MKRETVKQWAQLLGKSERQLREEARRAKRDRRERIQHGREVAYG